MLRIFRTLLLCTALILSGVVSAQEDLGWLIGLLPSGNEAGIGKLLRQGEQVLAPGAVLLEVGFEAPEAWPPRNSNYGFSRVQDGQYLVNSDLQDFTMTGIGGPVARNTLIQVRTRQLSTESNNGYGLVCRANPSGEGYYFFIGSDGFFRITQQTNGSMIDLIPWSASSAINQGQNAENQLAAVCFEDYLALYANGVLLGQVRSNTLREGQVGMMGATYVDGNLIEVAFDDLRVTDLLLPGGATPPPPPTGDQALVEMLRSGSQPIELLRMVQEEPFNEPGSWEPYSDEDGNRVGVENGVLRVISTLGDGFIYRTQNNVRYTDFVAQFETNQISEEPDNGFGIICRASPQRTGRGYYLYISGDGYSTLLIGDGSEYRYAVDWALSEAIQQVGRNLVTAVCVQDYIALYANGTLLFEFRDGLYTSGNIGFSALGFPTGAYTEIEFDNLRVWEARPAR